MSVATVAKTTANLSTEALLAVDVYDIIYHAGEPTECPLITLTGGNLYTEGENKPKKVEGKIKRKETIEVSYKVIEKDPLARTLTVASAVSDTTTTTVVTSSNTNATVGDTVRNNQTGEVMLVYAVDSGGANLSCRRNLGSTSYQIAAGDTLSIVGWAGCQGGAKRSLKSQLAAARERYCQIFKRTLGVTDTALQVVLETKNVDAWDEEMEQAMVEHKRDIEYSFWFNAYADSSTDASSYTVYLTRGLIAELTNYTTISSAGQVVDGLNNIDEETFFGPIAEQIFEYGPSTKTLFVDAKAKSKMNTWERVKVQNKSKDTDFGITVDTVQTGHGTLNVICCGVFDKFLQDSEKGYAVALDLDRVHYRYIKNRDSKFQDHVETTGYDAREAQYITECGLALLSLPHHMIVKNW